MKTRRMCVITLTALTVGFSIMTYSTVSKLNTKVDDSNFNNYSEQHQVTVQASSVYIEEPPIIELTPNIKIDTHTVIEDPNQTINNYIRDICTKYDNISPELIMSVVYHESRYNPYATNGECLGLMQVSTKWHLERARELGATNFYDSYDNLLIGIDYLSELKSQYGDESLILMLYNMNHDTALAMYNEGIISDYAKSVLNRADNYRKGV